MGKLTLKDLPEQPGTAFMSSGVAMMTITMDAMRELYEDGEIDLTPGADLVEDEQPGRRAVIYLQTGRGTILKDSIEIQVPVPRPFTEEEKQSHDDLRDLLDECGFDCGPRFPHGVSSSSADTSRHQSAAPNLAASAKHANFNEAAKEKDANDRFFEDRKRKLEELNREAQLQGQAAVRDETPPPDLTRGDAAVESARNGMLRKVDEALVSFDTTKKLFKKFSVDPELEAAFNSGLDGFAQYRKLRSKKQK